MPTVEDFGRYGVELMNKEGTAFAFNDAKGVELLTKYKELYDAKALDPQALTATPESSGKKFLTEAVAMNPGSALDSATSRSRPRTSTRTSASRTRSPAPAR